MSMAPIAVSAEVPAAPVATGTTAAKKDASWFVRITIIVVVILWLIPTLGVLITSFRDADAVDTTGWWTVLAHPFRGSQWTLENYRQALDSQGFETPS
jgi:alpha-glucoside transport system permease protein